MRVFKEISILVVFLSVLFQNGTDTYLQQGLELEEEGYPTKALELWDSALTITDQHSLAIATQYLRIAAEYELTDYYESATSIYMKTLSEPERSSNGSDLEKEVHRVGPLLEEDEWRVYQQLLEERNSDLVTKISNFWLRLDPTPDTINNERLIEHWQRIVYARESFTLDDEDPYGTDIRGEFYVKYGEPDKLEKGRVQITYDEIQTVLNQLIPIQSDEVKGGNNMDLMKVANQIQNLFLNPEYEVWIYNTPGNMTENMVLIFGKRSGAKFERLQTLEDFIPESAFNQRVQSLFDKGLPPVPAGMVLQWLFYEHFASIDPYFTRLFSEYYSTMQRYIGLREDMPPDPMAVRLIKEQNLQSAYQVYRREPNKFSTEEKKIPEIPIEIFQYKLLDESNHPVLVTFMESWPLQAFLTDYTANQDEISQSGGIQVTNEENSVWYDLVHGIQLRHGNGEILAANSQSPRLVFYPDEPFISSVFVIPWSSEEINQVFYAKLLNNHPKSKPREHSVFSNSLRGLGKYQIPQPEPLEIEAGKMVMSDLVFGYQKSDQKIDQSFFDFVVANDRRVPEDENLVIHFELYELETDEKGMTHFEVEYEITPKSGVLGWANRKKDAFNITLNFENFGDRFSESIEIDADGLEPDEYKLVWTVRDLESSRIQEEKFEFEVLESPGSVLSTNSVD